MHHHHHRGRRLLLVAAAGRAVLQRPGRQCRHLRCRHLLPSLATAGAAVLSSSSSSSSSSCSTRSFATATATTTPAAFLRAGSPSSSLPSASRLAPSSSSLWLSGTSTTPSSSSPSRRRMSTGDGNDAVASSSIGRDVRGAMEILRSSDCVCFDVDSTVINEEGIDVLADYLGKGEEVSKLTLRAMEGGMKFQDALKLRLELLRPSRGQILQCLEDAPLHLTAGVEEFIAALHDRGKDVYLVSGGFRIMIEPVAKLLNIPGGNVVANTILFDEESGGYVGFDPDEPTSRDMGKPRALEEIRRRGNYRSMVMIGDGATDAQAKPPARAFIGFGGVAIRETVRNEADWFVTDFDDLTRCVSS